MPDDQRSVDEVRRTLEQRGLRERDLLDDPYAQFLVWFDEARAAGVHQPEAMAVATVDADGAPSVRLVLLRALDERGPVFFTNYESRKAEDLAANTRVAAVLVWHQISRQVRIEGRAERVAPDESDRYFASRPRGSQIGAWASPQSQVVADRAALDALVDDVERRFPEGTAVPRPPHWGGIRIVPDTWELWQGQANRLHDRLRYTREPDGTWRRERLAP